jgi:hypothetical protein
MTKLCGVTLIAVAAGAAPLACSSSNGNNSVSDGPPPSVTITSPTNGGTVSIASSTDVPVMFSVENFMLKAPGGCGSININCGHVHVLVDATACNGPGLPYNSDFPSSGSATSPATATAHLSTCTTAAGMHTITIELHNDAHGLIAINNVPVEESVTITAQ